MAEPTSSDENNEKEAHLLGDSLLNSIVGDSNSFNEPQYSLTWDGPAEKTLAYTSEPSRGWPNAPVHPQISFKHAINSNQHNEWDSFYTPFGPMKTPLKTNESFWLPHSARSPVFSPNSHTNNANSNNDLKKIHQDDNTIINRNGDNFNQKAPKAPKIISYSDVASKPAPSAAQSKNQLQYTPVNSQRRLSTVKDALGPQSSSDSLSEASCNGGIYRAKDSDNESEQSGLSANNIANRKLSSQSDKLTNLYRNNMNSSKSGNSPVSYALKLASLMDEKQNTFTKNATTVTDSSDFKHAGGKRKNSKTFSKLLADQVDQQTRRIQDSSSAQTQNLHKKIPINAFLKLNNDEENISSKIDSMIKNGGRKGSYIRNDLRTPDAPLLSEQNDLTRRDESSDENTDNNGQVKENELPETEIVVTNKSKGRDRTKNVQKQQQMSFANSKIQAKSGKKVKNWENNLDSAEKSKRKKKNANALTSSINLAISTFVLYLQSIVMWFFNLITDIAQQLADILIHCAKSCYAKCYTCLHRSYSSLLQFVRKSCLIVHQKEWKFVFWWRARKRNDAIGFGLEDNIRLPNTGEEALRRLLLCKGQDAYSILGVKPDCTDEELKHYYRRQAVLVHPDKNSSYGADEAFKILAAAFELVGTPQHRKLYDIENLHRTKAMKDLEDMLTKLREKMEEVRTTMHCDCGKKHKRFVTERELCSARYCRRCRTYHAAQNGDIWAESRWFGFLWYYFACMEGAIYDITEWAGCQKNNLKHIKANEHFIKYRLTTGLSGTENKQNQGGVNRNVRDGKMFNDKATENFLNQLLNHNFQNFAGSSAPSATAHSATSVSNSAGDFQTPASAHGTMKPDFPTMHSKFQPPTCNQTESGRPRKGGRRRKGSRV